ncbi:MAG: endolytic transglycosylase MltG [Paludibacteraceae bacterium]|nr:endolytic transglycosylase MltG [Paludibacteraceae bacterium]
MNKKTGKILLIVAIVIAALLFLSGSFVAEQMYRYQVCNFTSRDGKSHGYHVYPDMDADSLFRLMQNDYDVASVFDWQLHKRYMMYTQPKVGYYEFPERIGNGPLIKRLMRGGESPVHITWTNQIRTHQQLAGRLAVQLMLDSATIEEHFASEDFMRRYDLTPETAVCMFLPNTYEVYWSYSIDDLFNRMKREFDRFWSDERQQKADALGLKRSEVATVASIVESETRNKEEKPLIASLYLNRVRKGMALQACPTVIFATGDFKLRRVLTRHLKLDSPYNTYLYRGLPPGPIRCCNAESIDMVLNAPKTDYLFMCANPDFSGTHVFSSNYRQHAAVAAQYRHALDERQIK